LCSAGRAVRGRFLSWCAFWGAGFPIWGRYSASSDRLPQSHPVGPRALALPPSGGWIRQRTASLRVFRIYRKSLYENSPVKSSRYAVLFGSGFRVFRVGIPCFSGRGSRFSGRLSACGKLIHSMSPTCLNQRVSPAVRPISPSIRVRRGRFSGRRSCVN
jgi:hypothetical protein